jgi:ribosomal protein S18 acetylase RimI-like enzyme
MENIRPFRSRDLDDLYRICLSTGAGGSDASGLYRDPKLLGHVYAAPYALLNPQTVFVAEDGEGIAGYIVGAADTIAFETRLEAEWWPDLRASYAEPMAHSDAPFDPDERMQYLIHHPLRTPRRISGPYPSHLHINLLPRLQGRGIGSRLIRTWLRSVHDMGSGGAHLAVGESNFSAVRFYRARGFRELERIGPPFNVIWFGIEF